MDGNLPDKQQEVDRPDLPVLPREAAGTLGVPLPALLLLATAAVTDCVHERLADAGFPGFRANYGYAFQLLASTGGATGVQLARHLGITKQSAGELLARLSQAGYVSMTPHPADARANVSTLSQRGWDCIRAAEQIWCDVEVELAERCGAQDAATTRRFLGHVVALFSGGVLPQLKPPR